MARWPHTEKILISLPCACVLKVYILTLTQNPCSCKCYYKCGCSFAYHLHFIAIMSQSITNKDPVSLEHYNSATRLRHQMFLVVGKVPFLLSTQFNKSYSWAANIRTTSWDISPNCEIFPIKSVLYGEVV
jgi:hypothetical protein